MAIGFRGKEKLVLLLVGLVLVQVAGCSGLVSGGSKVAPKAPSELSVTMAKGHVSLGWNASSGATTYEVKRSTISGGPYAEIGYSFSTHYTDVGLAAQTYFYVVSAVNPAGQSANSTQIIAKLTNLAPPSSPGAISVIVSPASGSLNARGTLSFTDLVQGLASDKSVTWSATLGSITSSGVYTAPPGAGIAKVTATSNADPTHSASATVAIIVPASPTPIPPVAAVPSPPDGLSAAVGNGQVSLSWSASSGATAYEVKRSTLSPTLSFSVPSWRMGR